MANNNGAFFINKNSAIPINTTTAYRSFLTLRKNEKSTVIIAGFSNGLELYEYKEHSFKNLGALPGFVSSPRSMVIDKNQSLWVGTSFDGIFKIDFDKGLKPAYKNYTEANGLPSRLRNRICKIKNQIFSATEKGVYQYNPQKDVFEVSPFYDYFFREKDIRLLKEDNEGNVWFIEGKNVGLIDLKGNEKSVLYFPELNGKIVSGNSLEYIMPYNRYNTFIGSEKGFFQINLEEYKKNINVPQVKIISAGSTGNIDSLFFGGYFGNVNEVRSQFKTAIPEISSSLNSLHFEYSSPSYSYQSSIQYSFILEGFDNQWSVWTRNGQKDYTNLSPGTFTFKVKAKTSLGKESTVDFYTFTILAPWYRTWWAYLLHCIIIAALVYLAYKEQKKLLANQKRKYEEEQKRQQYLHKLELENSEKEIIALRNEKLKAELEGKNSELASVAMHMVHKGEILSKVKDELVRLKKVSDEDGTSDNVKKLIKALKEEDKMDEEWNQFATHFDNIHSNFTKALKNTYPIITQNEIKLCSYLHMNLSSKQIAQLLNISVRGVEISRYRLRKKLQIPTEINLNEFFQNFHEKEGQKASFEN
ncbi:MAG: triple tyrosine motif-containing protein [Segetibacter sp.]